MLDNADKFEGREYLMQIETALSEEWIQRAIVDLPVERLVCGKSSSNRLCMRTRLTALNNHTTQKCRNKEGCSKRKCSTLRTITNLPLSSELPDPPSIKEFLVVSLLSATYLLVP